jgi:hypothetical protein
LGFVFTSIEVAKSKEIILELDYPTLRVPLKLYLTLTCDVAVVLPDTPKFTGKPDTIKATSA